MRSGTRRFEGLRAQLSLIDGGGATLFAALTLVNVASFLFHLVVSRALGPAQYGALSPLLGLLLVLSVPTGALQALVTREISKSRGDLSHEGPPVPIAIGRLLSQAVLMGAAAFVALVVAAPALVLFLHLPSLTSAVMLAAYVLPVVIGVVPKGVLLGELRFRRVAFALLGGAIVRVLLGYLFVLWRTGVEGAMAATVLSEVVTVGLLLPSIRPFVASPAAKETVDVRWREAGGAVVAFAGFWLLTATDTVLARHYLPRRESGLYAAAATAARATMFLPSAVSLIAFPRFAADRGRAPSARKALVQALGIVGAMSTAAAVAVASIPGVIIQILFGSEFRAAATAVGVLAASSACVGVIGVLLHYFVAARRLLAASLPWLAVMLVAVSVGLFHSSLRTVAVAVLMSTGLVLAVMLGLALYVPKPLRSSQGGTFCSSLEPELDLTIVVPYYNPGANLRENIDRLVAVLHRSGQTFEVIAVSDGSTDGSDQLLDGLSEVVQSIVLPANAGKGQAVRVGLAMGRGRHLGFIDADGDVDPAHIEPFLALVKLYDPDVVLGSKRHPMSEVSYPPIRHIYSWGYQQLVRVLFRLNIRDTQTGLKIVRRDVLTAVLPRMVEKRFAFDLELFVVARYLGFRRFFDAPVRIQHQFTSTISWRAVGQTLKDTVAIFYRLRVLNWYDRPLSPGEVSTELAVESSLGTSEVASSVAKITHAPHHRGG